MRRSHGPWSSHLAWQAVQLSSFWRRRLTMLPLTAAPDARRSLRWNLAVATVAIGVLFSPTLYLSGAPAIEPDAKPPSKSELAPGAPVRVELPGGIVYEFIGVAAHPSQGGPWWGADGEPIAAPYHKHPAQTSEPPPKKMREFAMREVKKGDKGANAHWNVWPNGSSGGGRPRDTNGKPIEDLRSLSQALPGDATTCTIRFECAAGEWQTEAETDGQSTSSFGNQKYSFGFAPTAQRDGKLVLSIAHSVLDKDLRIIAIDLQGREITTGEVNSVGGRGFLQTTAAFAELDAKNVKEFRLQSRSYETVEIQNISLDPTTKTQPKVVVIKDAKQSPAARY
jgi:hypothetical protein